MLPQRVFCKYSTLIEAFNKKESSHPYAILYSIIQRVADLYLEIPKYQIDQKAITEPALRQLSRGGNKNLRSYNDNIKIQVDNALFDDLFIVDPKEIPNSSLIRKQRGILVIDHVKEMNLLQDLSYRHYRPFSLVPNRHFENNPSYERTFSWRNVFNSFPISPINAVIITDNFLFKKRERNSFSLFEIIRNLIPYDLKIPFHISIFFNNGDGSVTKEMAQSIIEQIHKLVDNKKILVQIIAHTNKSVTHDRVILTNYHYIISGVGFNVIDSSGVKEVARGTIESVFHNIDMNLTEPNVRPGTTIKHLHNQTLLWLKKEIYDKNSNTNIVYIVGDEFVNRLFNSVS
ncbi:MAG: hypothetical protein LIP09_10505 [Bacteroidales bacterium]|nr:hypothetical protein [Bacteroidales bacterium]